MPAGGVNAPEVFDIGVADGADEGVGNVSGAHALSLRLAGPRGKSSASLAQRATPNAEHAAHGCSVAACQRNGLVDRLEWWCLALRAAARAALAAGRCRTRRGGAERGRACAAGARRVRAGTRAGAGGTALAAACTRAHAVAGRRCSRTRTAACGASRTV